MRNNHLNRKFAPLKTLVVIFFVFLIHSVTGQEMRIGVLRDYSVQRITFSYYDTVYHVYGDTTFIGEIHKDEFAETQVSGNKVVLKLNTISKGTFNKVYIRSTRSGSVAILKSKTPIVRERKYQDDFEITSTGKNLTIVNLVDMDNYLSGVLESEGGGGRHIDYYKVQALMSRTYALKNQSRHKKEGFELCDRVHCQAYHNMLRFTPTIRTAVEETTREILVNESDQLVTTYFSANCGGEVCDAAYVWNNSVPYVVPFLDTFCIHTKQATWTKKVPKSKWIDFLVRQYNYPIKDSVMAEHVVHFHQDQRKAFFIHPSLGIPLRDLRKEFRLKSTFFDVYPEGDQVVLKGKGFGHGVGLCQEGAMEMAKKGYSYRQIALFYFSGVKIIKKEEELE